VTNAADLVFGRRCSLNLDSRGQIGDPSPKIEMNLPFGFGPTILLGDLLNALADGLSPHGLNDTGRIVVDDCGDFGITTDLFLSWVPREEMSG